MKSILILGAGEGIGLAVARRFQAEGFKVGLAARHPDPLNIQVPGSRTYPADAGDFTQLAAVVKQAETDLGGLDVLVYNVAAANWNPLLETDADSLMRDLRVNVGGAHAAVLAALPGLRASGGSVLMTGGGLALFPGAQAGALAAGKAGMRSLALSLHAELMPQGVHVGTVTVMGLVGDDQKVTAAGVAEQFWSLYQTRLAEIQYSG